MNDVSQEAAGGDTLPTLLPVIAISDDLWNAINRKQPSACREHTAWADTCAPLHQPAGAVAA